MPLNDRVSDKKKALLAHKEKILQDIKYYEKRLEDFGATASSKVYFDECYSSDSEDDFPTTIDNGPNIPKLKIQQAMLRTCLQATEELTSLHILQSEVNVMVEDPVIEGEPPVTEPGIWREVIAECRIDSVPFSITFYVHQPNRRFGPSSFRGVKVLLIKTAHETELAQSILPRVYRPSDAIEVIRSFAVEHRSRRTTLAALADKYAHNLFMAPLAEGGYTMKCANLTELSWRLENKWSPLAPFRHRMKFDLEYMDETYIKIIAQAHKQLSDPSLLTDERTQLLSTIINTCLEAQGPTQELYESMESDPESVKNLQKRRTTLDQDEEAPLAKKQKEKDDEKAREKATDDQIMAPPKSLPKKVKPKGKENMNGNRKSVKRSNIDEGNSNKKARIDKDAPISIRDSVNQIEAKRIQNKTGQDTSEKSNQKSAKTVDIEKNLSKAGASKKNTDGTEKNIPKVGANQKNTEKSSGNNIAKVGTNKKIGEKKASKDNEKGKDAKKPKQDAKEVVSEANFGQNTNNKIAKSDSVPDKMKDLNEKQEQAKKKVSPKVLGQQNVANKDKIPSHSKEGSKTKVAEAQEATEDKTAGSSKNKKTESKGQKVANKEAHNNAVDNKIKKNTKTDQSNKPKTSETIYNKDRVSKNKKPVAQSNEINTNNGEISNQGEKHKNNTESNANRKASNIEPNKGAKNDQTANGKNATDTKNATNNTNNTNNPTDNTKNATDNTKNVTDNTKTLTKNTKNVTDNTNNTNNPTDNTKNATDNTKNATDNTKNLTKNTKNVTDNTNNTNNPTDNTKNVTDNTKNATDNTKNPTKNTKNATDNTKHPTDNTKNPTDNTKNATKNTKNATDHVKNLPNSNASNKPQELTKKTINQTKTDKTDKPDKNMGIQKHNTQKIKVAKPKITEKNVFNSKPNEKKMIPKNIENNSNQKSNEKGDTIEKSVKVKHVATRAKEHIADRTNAKNNIKTGAATKPNKVIKNLSHKNPSAQNKLPKNTGNTKKDVKSGNTKDFITGNIGKETGSAGKVSRIPQKMLSPISESAIKKNPLRISPRKISSTFKSTSDSCIQKFQKPITNIPRLMKKPVNKLK